MAKQRIAVIGCGLWGRNIVRNFYNLNVLEIVCDLDDDNIAKVKEMYPDLKVTKDFNDIINNPEITAVSGDVAERDEGCLSVPEIYAPVVRPARVAFRAQLLSGIPIEGECGGLLGRCLQHEIDHLDGYLFTDRLSPEAARRIEGQFKRLVEFGKSHDFRRVTRK